MDIHANDARYAAEASPDVSAERVGEVYAEALFGVLENDPVRVGEMLEEFGGVISEGLTAFPDFEKVLSSRLVGAEEKIGMLDRVFGTRVSPMFLNFLRVVARHERLDCLRAIYARAVKRQDVLLGRVNVTVTTAAEILSDQTLRIADTLRGMLKGNPEISHQVDPSIIGGPYIRINGYFLDRTVKRRLRDMTASMKERCGA